MFQNGKISIWVVIILVAVSAVVLAEGILIFKFWQVAEQEIPNIKETTEQQTARYVFDKFMEARMANQKDQAITYFTENAMQQHINNEFVLVNDFKSFKLLKSEKLEEMEKYPGADQSGFAGYRFIVEIYEQNDINDFIEAITIIKISDRYFVNSVEFPG